MIKKENKFEAKSGCRFHCLIELEEGNSALCNNSEIVEEDEASFNSESADDSEIRFDLDSFDGGMIAWNLFK